MLLLSSASRVWVEVTWMIRRTTTQTLAIRRILIYSIVALTLTFGLSGSATAVQVSAPVTPAEQPTLREGQAPATTIPQTADKHAPGEFRLSKERYDKAVAYTQTEYVLYFVSVGWGILVLVLMLRLGIVARLRDFAERTTASRFAQSLIFIPTLLLILALLHLPLSIVGHRQALRYELSIQGWSSWFWDWCKAEFLMVSLLFLLVWVLLYVMRWRPRTWWLYFWFALIPIALFLFFISPWFFDPLFNTFHSL